MKKPREDYAAHLVAALPADCRRALDVGCGYGDFARRLVAHGVPSVDAVDRCTLGVASENGVHFIEGDFMTLALVPESYDFVSAIASLHHLPLEPALARMASLLRPGGVLGIVGLYRDEGLVDFCYSGVAYLGRLWHGRAPESGRPPPPLATPTTTLRQIAEAATRTLPGAMVERHLYWRYTILWQKP